MADYICTSCGYQGKKKAILPGSGTTELVLWIVFLIPGPFYSIWRRIIGRKWGCPQCGNQAMVPLDSLAGKAKLNEIEQDIAPDELKKIPNMWQKDIDEYNKKQGTASSQDLKENNTIENNEQQNVEAVGDITNSELEENEDDSSLQDKKDEQW